MSIFFLGLLIGWLALTVLCACRLAGHADELIRTLQQRQQRNRRRHTLGRWLRFHGGIK